MLKIPRDFSGATEVQEKGQRIDVQDATNGDREKRPRDETEVPDVSSEGENGETYVRENEVLGEEVEQVERLYRARARLLRQVLVRVMLLRHPAEQQCDYSRPVRHLRGQEAAVRHDEEQRRFQDREAADLRELRDERVRARDTVADQQRAEEDREEAAEGSQRRVPIEFAHRRRLVSEVVLNGAVQDDRHGIVEHALAEDQRVQVDIDLDIGYDRQHRDRIRGGDHRSEQEALGEVEGIRHSHENGVTVDDGAGGKSRNDRAD